MGLERPDTARAAAEFDLPMWVLTLLRGDHPAQRFVGCSTVQSVADGTPLVLAAPEVAVQRSRASLS
jgi:hypothetical protein